MQASDLLAYATDPVAFIDDLVTKNELGQPWRLFAHDREILRLALAFDEDGRLPWDTLLWCCIKKDGKSWKNAVMVVWWGFTQEPPNEIDIRSNDLEQSLSRVFKMVVGLLKHNPVLGQCAKVLSDRIFLSNDTIIRAIPQDWKGESGGNQGLISYDELWAYTSENARRAWDEAPPVPTRKNSIRLVTSYAGIEGESDLLKEQYLLGVGKEEHPEGQAERIHPMLPVYANREARLFCYWDHEPRMPWQTPKYLAARRRDHEGRPNTWLRQYENRWTVAESAYITAELWDQCVESSWSPADDDSALPVWAGFDVGTHSDCTAVAVITVDDGLFILVDHRIWRPSKENPMDLEHTLEAFIRNIARRFNLVAAFGDPYQAFRSVVTLKREGLRVKEFPQSEANVVKQSETLYTLIRNRRLVVYPDPELRQQAMNAVGIESVRGVRIAKASASRKVDGIVALSIACCAAIDVPVSTPLIFV